MSPRYGVGLAVGDYIGRRIGLHVADVDLEAPQRIADLAAWYDSRTNAYMALAGSSIVGWNSRAGTLGPVPIMQGSAPAQPSYAQAVPALNGRNGVAMGGSSILLNSDSRFKFLHQGSGGTVIALVRVDGTQASNRLCVTGNSLSSSGLDLNLTVNTNNRVSSRIYNSNGTAAANALNADHSLSAEGFGWMAWSYGAGASSVRTSGKTITQADASAPDTNDALPNGNLSVGFGSGTGLKGYLCQLLIFTRVLTDAEVLAVATWFAEEYGLQKSIKGTRSFSGANYFYTTPNAGAGIRGVASGFNICVVAKLDAQATTATRHLARHSTGGADGWFLTALNANTAIRFGAYSAAGVYISQQVSLAGLNGLRVFHGVHDGARVRFSIDGIEVGSQAITGFAQSPTSAFTMLGHTASEWSVFGLCGGHAVPTQAQIQAHVAAIKAAGRIVAMPSVQTDHLWVPEQLGTIQDQIGTDNMSMAGTLDVVTHTGLQWAA